MEDVGEERERLSEISYSPRTIVYIHAWHHHAKLRRRSNSPPSRLSTITEALVESGRRLASNHSILGNDLLAPQIVHRCKAIDCMDDVVGRETSSR